MEKRCRRSWLALLVMWSYLGLTACGQVAPSLSAAAPGRGTFHVRGTQLLDPSGKPFVMRGINNPHSYFPEEAQASLGMIKSLGFNAVRIIWCADTVRRTDRCENKDIRPLRELARTLARLRQLKLVAVLNLQNATGSDDLGDLARMVDYLLKPEVKKLLMAYKDMLLINIANEWYSSWDDSERYFEGYRDAITRLRWNGIPHVLIVDARGWGQELDSLRRYGPRWLKVDPNLLLSAHMYELYGTAASVQRAMQTMRDARLPFLVGEFACGHRPGQVVACDAIMREAARAGHEVGTIAWSFSGNREELAGLNVAKFQDWRTLTPWGKSLIYAPFGVRATAKPACVFGKSPSCR